MPVLSLISVEATKYTRPNWTEISLTALQHNFRTITDFVAPNATVCAVVKCDGYGHGAVECARALEQESATWFGVTSTDEGIRLRDAGITGRILVMTGFWRGEEEAIVHYDLTPAIWERAHVEALENAAAKLGKAPCDLPVHLKIDTGMARLGLPIAELDDFADVLRSAEHVVLEGVFSHFASSEVLDSPGVDRQLAKFESSVAALATHGLTPVYQHMSNSAAVIARPNTWKNMVRPGLALFGHCLPFTSVVSGTPDASLELPLQPVLSWKTRVIAMRDVAAGQAVGYNGAHVTHSPTRLAVIPVGYGDGFTRQLSCSGRVIVRGSYAGIAGNVSMDLTTIDVTAIPGVSIGDEVTLMGSSGDCSISVWEHASYAMTVPYEILCGLSPRVPRKYVE
ncbi:MAG TPA: alanine racemase [Clostridia bacterium]|nr:alanine racemase [Clostridia bacterium]